MIEVVFIDGPLRGQTKLIDGPTFHCYEQTEDVCLVGLTSWENIAPEPLRTKTITYQKIGDWFGVGLMASDRSLFEAEGMRYLSYWLDESAKKWLLSGGPFMETK